MAKSAQMVREYVCAGFRKIHLDCSMACADDPEPLPEATLATRAAQLCAVAESAWREVGGEPPVYVIGTEVPVPGGATEELHELAVTTPQAASATIAAHREAFAAAGLESAWPRVIALVVQPGVEFDHHKVIDYVPAARARAERVHRRRSAVRLRGAFHRLPDAGEPAGAGARSLRDPEGRARARPMRCARRCGRWPRSRASCRAATPRRICATVALRDDARRSAPLAQSLSRSRARLRWICSSASAIASATIGRTRRFRRPASRC